MPSPERRVAEAIDCWNFINFRTYCGTGAQSMPEKRQPANGIAPFENSPLSDEQLIDLATRFIDGMNKTIDFFINESFGWDQVAMIEDSYGDRDQFVERAEKQDYSRFILPFGFANDHFVPPFQGDPGEFYSDIVQPYLSKELKQGKLMYEEHLGALIEAAEIIQKYVDDPGPLAKLTDIYYSPIEPELTLKPTLPQDKDEVPTDKDTIPTHGSLRAFGDKLEQTINAWLEAKAGLEAWLTKERKAQELGLKTSTFVPAPKEKRGRKRLSPDRERLYCEINRLWNRRQGEYKKHQELADKLNGKKWGKVTRDTVRKALDWGRHHPERLKHTRS